MARQLIWTPRADRALYQITSYWEANWSEKAFRKALDEVFKVLESLTHYPEMGKVEKPGIRGYVIRKRLKVHYRIEGEEVVLMNFFDTRTNPNSH